MATRKQKKKLTSKQSSRRKPLAEKKSRKSAAPRGRSVRSRRTSTGSGVITRATGTLSTALGGVTEATLEKGSTALSALGNSMRAAQSIGSEIVKAMTAAGSPQVARPARRSAAKPRKRSRPPTRKE